MNDAIDRVLEKYRNKTVEEIKRDFDRHTPGWVYESLMQVDWMESGVDKIREEQEYFRVHNNIHFRDVV